MVERLRNMAEGTQGPGREGPKILIADKSGNVVGERPISQTPSWRPAVPSEGAGGPPEVPPPPVLQPPEVPPPPDRNSLEFEASPERGREIGDEITTWEALRAAGRLNEVNWPRLNQLYQEQEIHIEALSKASLAVIPFEPDQQPQQPPPEILTVNQEALNNLNLSPISELIDVYNRNAILPQQVPEFQRQVSAYFREAKRIGLLKDIDAVLTSAYERQVKAGINRELTSVDIMSGNRRAGIEGVDERIQVVLNSLADVYRDRRWIDPGINRLVGIGDLYAQFVRERFLVAINNQDPDGFTQRPYIDGEFRLGQTIEGEAPQEKFWRVYQGFYIEIYAQTEEEFMIAVDDYLSRLESVTADPKKILDDASRFVDVLIKSEGATKLLQTNEGADFINELVLGIEARIGVFGADTSNELYNNDFYKQYMDYINKDGKGPARWLALLRLLDAQVAADVWALDNDPRWEILFSLFGSRGQLAKASDAQRNGVGDQGLFAQVRAKFIEEMMGVTIKDKRNVANVTRWMSDRKFTNMFEGLFRYGKVPEGREHGDTNIRAWEQLKQQLSEQGQEMPDDRRLTRAQRLGRIQLDLREGKKLNQSDQRFYDRAWKEAEKAFDIAFQIYGALGEKSKRAGGVFKTDEKVDSDGKKFQWFVPIHYAEKFVQFAETMTKMKYANSSARDRTAMVKQARDRAITELKKNGFEAKLSNADGTPMMLRRPKEDPNAPDELARDASGNVIVEEVTVDFYTATHHPYGDWTSHTYWSYQEEDRHRLLRPTSFAQARKIRDGEIRPEDADPWAIQLLILDPTLKRVRRFHKNFEDRERKLTMAAVEDSYQSHWRIGRELYRAFFPKYGTPAKDIGVYYGLQDYGGFRKMIEHSRARAMEDPERFARRGRRLLPDIHIPAAALSEIWGQGSVGAMGVIRMLGAPIYRMGGTFALDKFHAQSEIAGMIYDSLFVSKKDNEGIVVEPLLLKLTNESDTTLQQFFGMPNAGVVWGDPGKQQEFCVAVRKSFGRLERYEKLLVTMESLIRNATGAQWLENVDVLTANGQLNSEIERRFAALPDISRENLTRGDLARFITGAEELEEMSEEEFNSKFNAGDENNEGIDEGILSVYTGSGRHSARIFHDNFFEVFLDEGKRGGAQLYRTERDFYKHLKDKIVFYDPVEQRSIGITSDYTIKDWLFAKMVPT